MNTAPQNGRHNSHYTHPGKRVRSLVTPVFLMVAALLIRIPKLYQIPVWGTANENFRAIEILNGQWPLINQYPHTGALSNYIVAGFLLLLGPHWWVTRLVSLVFGVLTVVLTYFLGLKLYRYRVALAAGLIMMVSWYHVVITSHFPWTNSLTPFFAVCFLLAFSNFSTAAPGKKRKLLAGLSGILFGFGLQSHPEFIIFIPVIIIQFLRREKHPFSWLKSSEPFILLMSALTGYANMVYFNLVTGFESVHFMLDHPKYALVNNYAALGILANYSRAILHTARTMLGIMDKNVVWSRVAVHPMVLLFLAALIWGVRAEWKTDLKLSSTVLISGLLILPMINKGYNLELGRYLVFLFIPVSLLLGLTFDVFMRTGNRFSHLIKPLGILLAAVFLVFPLVNIRAYYDRMEKEGRNREMFTDFLRMIKEQNVQKPYVFIDAGYMESIDFRQILMVEHIEAFLLRPEELLVDIGLQQEIADIVNHGTDRSAFVAVSPLNQNFFLSRFPVQRVIGNIDRVVDGKWIDYFRVYQIAPRDSDAWLNPDMICTRIQNRTPFLVRRRFSTPKPDYAVECALKQEQTDSGDISVSLRLKPLKAEPVDVCFGVRTPDGTVLYFPGWTKRPVFSPATIQKDTDYVSVFHSFPFQDAPGEYTFFLTAFKPGTLMPKAAGAVLTVSIPDQAQ